MDELEEIRKRKLEQFQSQAAEEQQVMEQVAQLETAVKQKLDKKALERYGNVKTAHPQKAIQVLAVCAQLIQSGHNMITDEELKQILIRMEPPKRETKIIRK
ncbi:DNA-binding protein [Nanoarchaeota archaeon]